MQNYEIRILRDDFRTDIIMQMTHLNDNAAIRAARKFAEARPFEVWRGMDCIYGRPGSELQSAHVPMTGQRPRPQS